jgi:murein DD-endopeptidase MepM/ murein hydrolase activator NlpD
MCFKFLEDLKKKKRRAELVKQIEEEKAKEAPAVPSPKNTHHDYVAPKITQADKALLKSFLEDHNNFDEFHYRKGARYTAYFGIARGWGENMVDGYVRIHQGVDRAGGGSITNAGKTINDIVMSPMHFDATGFIDYGNRSYGSLVFLTSNKYQFDFRIAHMNPETDIIPWSLQQFKLKKPFKQNWYIGSAGTYGYSTGAHTHTEIISHDEACEVMELMLLERHGEVIYKEYSDEEIVAFYRKQAKTYPKTSPYVNWTDGEILNDWLNIKRKKGIFFLSKYKCCFFYNNKPYTRYATNEILEGL